MADDRGEPLLGRLRLAERRATCSSSGSTASCCRCTRRSRSRSQSRSPRSRPGAARQTDRSSDAPLRPSLHPGPPHRRGVRPDGERPGARLRRDAGDQRGSGGADHPRRLPELHALQPLRDRPVRRAADHHAGDVRARGRRCSSSFLRPLRDEEREELSLLVTWAIALGIEGLLERRLPDDVPLDDHELRRPLVARVRVLHLGGARLRVRRLDRRARRCCSRSCGSRSSGAAIRATVQNPTAARLLGVDTRMVSARRLRAQRRDRERRRRRVRDRLPVQSGQPLRPDLAAAHDHRPRRARLARRRRGRRALHGRRRSRSSRPRSRPPGRASCSSSC